MEYGKEGKMVKKMEWQKEEKRNGIKEAKKGERSTNKTRSIK